MLNKISAGFGPPPIDLVSLQTKIDMATVECCELIQNFL